MASYDDVVGREVVEAARDAASGCPAASRSRLRQWSGTTTAVSFDQLVVCLSVDDAELALALVEDRRTARDKTWGELSQLVALLHQPGATRQEAVHRQRRAVRRAVGASPGVAAQARALLALVEQGPAEPSYDVLVRLARRSTGPLPLAWAGRCWALAGLLALRTADPVRAVDAEHRAALADPGNGLHQELRAALGIAPVPPRADRPADDLVRAALAGGEGLGPVEAVLARFLPLAGVDDVAESLPLVAEVLRTTYLGHALRERLLSLLALFTGLRLRLDELVSDIGPLLRAVQDVLGVVHDDASRTALAHLAVRDGDGDAAQRLLGERRGGNEAVVRALLLWRQGLVAQSAAQLRAAHAAVGEDEIELRPVWQAELEELVGA